MLSFKQLIYFALLTWKKGPKTGRKNQHQETKIQNNLSQKLGPQKEIAGQRRVQSPAVLCCPQCCWNPASCVHEGGCLRKALVAEGGEGRRNTSSSFLLHPLSCLCQPEAQERKDQSDGGWGVYRAGVSLFPPPNKDLVIYFNERFFNIKIDMGYILWRYFLALFGYIFTWAWCNSLFIYC